LLPEAARRRHVAKRVETRLLSLTDATLERGCAAEPAIDESAQHGGGEHQHDQGERRTILVFDMGVAPSHA